MVGAGEYIRSSAVVGNVVAADAMMSGGDGQPETLAGVTVTLGGEHAMGETMETDMSGGFAFTGLRAGTYTVTISDFPEDVSFEEVSLEISVEVGEVGQADFTGHFIRTSAVEGQVIIEGEGLAGVTVTLSGGPADESFTMMTDADGMYRFEELRPGDYTVSISDFDTRDYEFAATSQDVSVDLDETGTVSFTGVLLRTSGIAGRVSVEGMGLGGIEVTLSGGEEAETAMTDDGGQYNFAGLAAGDYTVSISVESDAYVFESMSTDVTVGDDESAIVNFEGMHARTASVSGMVFLDEATKNDMHDEGEHPLAHAGIPVALVGPGVNEQRVGATDATGAFSFSGLRSGPYQLVVLIDATVAAALAANDVAYGGPSTGYEIALGVGEAASQGIPFDITHTTVNFTVMLRHGDDMGAAVPGASVTLYSDADGETKVGSGDTGDDGSVMIKVARAGTSGNMVHAGVSADGYDGEGMTAVSWDPQMFATAGSNSHDLVNLSVDATVSGATITTDYGGGDALKGWAISVMHGDDAVDGAAEMLDDDGNAALMTTVTADDLPATFTFAVADDQDDKMDGGENFSATSVEYMHTGLALAGTMDAGTMEVAYSTQTLKVYVHEERDQVMGYTGNVLDGDKRDTAGNVSVGLRYIDGSGRSRAFEAADSIGSTSKAGVHTFSNVPADRNVIVQASKKTGVTDIKLLDPDELAAYTGMDANGITGGAFGEMGGFSHTVELCPLQAIDPTGQDHGECASFAYVNTHTVSGTVTKQTVAMDDGDGFKAVEDEDTEAGITVSLSTVEGKNLAGEEESFTTTEKDTRKDKTKGDNPMSAFTFADVAEGAYTVGVPSGWRYQIGGAKDTGEFSPLDDDVTIAVTPTTATVYGRVTGSDGFALDSVTVTANAQSTMTDKYGRYILDGIAPETRKIGSTTHSDRIFVQASAKGFSKSALDIIVFAANTVEKQDIDLSGVQNRATISGKVTASGTNAPIAGVEVKVDGKAPLNPNAKAKGSTKNDIYLTDADGNYSVQVEASPSPAVTNIAVSVSKDGWYFVPTSLNAPVYAGAEISGISFTGFVNGTFTGRVIRPGGGPMKGVSVRARKVGAEAGDATADSVDTGDTGTFSLNVPFGNYDIEALAEGYTFTPAGDDARRNVGPGQSVNFGAFKAPGADHRVSALKATRATNGTVSVTWENNVPETGANYAVAEVVQVCVASTCGTDDWKDTNVTASTDPATEISTVTDTGDDPVTLASLDGGFRYRIATTFSSAGDGTVPSTDAPVAYSAAGSLSGVNPRATSVAATRGVNASESDTIGVTWKANTTSRTTQRVVMEVAVTDARTEWLVATGAATITAGTGTAFSWTLDIGTDVAADGSTEWALADGSGDLAVDRADLLKALKVRVESRHGTTGDWLAGGTFSLGAKP